MKKKIIFGATILATALVVGVAAATAHEGFVKFGKSTDNARWNHYSSSAYLDATGNKEYWVSCASHEHQFVEPSSTNIVDMGTPSRAEIDSWDSNDDRLVQRAWQSISFSSASDLDLIFSVRDTFSVKEIVDDSTAPDYDGKVLQLTYKDGTADFMLLESYLDRVFSDANVVALNFNIKGTYAKDANYRQQSTSHRYEGNGAEGFGINTTWKTFSYPRSAYQAFKDDPNKSTINRNAFLYIGYTVGESIYLDNFHPVTRSLDWTGFEQGRNDTSKSYFSWRNSAGQETFYSMSNDSTTTLNWSYDDTIKSEGGRSVKISRAASENVFFGINRNNVDLNSLLPNSDSVLSFDLRTSITINCNANASSTLILQNYKISSSTNFQIPANTWIRLIIPKSKIDRNVLLSFTGSAVLDFWVDNVQFNTNAGSFEDETIIPYISTSDSKIDYGYCGVFRNPNKFTNIDYAKPTDLILDSGGSLGHVGLSATRKTEGNSSLWVEKINATELAIYFSYDMKTYLANNPGSKVKIDVFTTASLAGAAIFRDGNRNDLTKPTPNTWTTIELDSSNLTNDGRALITQGTNSIGDWYFDNIVLA